MRILLAGLIAVGWGLVMAARAGGAWLPASQLTVFRYNPEGFGPTELRDVGRGFVVDITHYPSDVLPQWSPDGTRLLWLERYLMTVSEMGGGLARYYGIGDGAFLSAGHWSGDDIVMLISSMAPDRTTVGRWEPGTDEAHLVPVADAAELLPSPTGDAVLVKLSAAQNEVPHVVVLARDSSQPFPLSDLPGGEWHPTWSPDGQRVAFYSNDSGRLNALSLYVVEPSQDGQPVRLLDVVVAVPPPVWLDDATLLAVGEGNAVYRVRVTDDEIAFIASLPDVLHVLVPSPDRRYAVIDQVSPDNDQNLSLFLLDLNSGETRRLAPHVFDLYTRVQWSPDSRFVVFRGSVFGLWSLEHVGYWAVDLHGRVVYGVDRYQSHNIDQMDMAWRPG